MNVKAGIIISLILGMIGMGLIILIGFLIYKAIIGIIREIKKKD